ncbi:MAG TPA: hypothetical protein PL183_14050 [Aquamicrobium sp.]|nr:hypothetical protein [Aquamicrobium sp.]
MRFNFPYSHAFNGGRVTVDDDGSSGPACTVEFGDGSIVLGEFTPDDRGMRLSVPAYETARGNTVRARTWLIVKSDDGSWRSMSSHLRREA